MKKKAMALVLALGLVVVGIVGGTMAWLTAEATKVENVFTDSDINITLTESDTDRIEDGDQHNYKMIPGHTITKDPKVTVAAGSEDCWLFVKITESTEPDLDAYIAYAIATGWKTVQAEDALGVTVIGRKVLKDDVTKSFDILGTGEYPVGGTETYTWGPNAVLTKPEVTKEMMDAIDDETEAKPTLTFQAAAVQLYETQVKEFDVATAYAKVAWSTGNS